MLHMLPLRDDNAIALWRASRCDFTPIGPQAAAYNAVHFNFDVDWILWVCDVSTYTPFVKGELSRSQLEAVVGAEGRNANFVRRILIPRYVAAMRTAFANTTLPIVLCSSLGKLVSATLWIADELEAAVRA